MLQRCMMVFFFVSGKAVFGQDAQLNNGVITKGTTLAGSYFNFSTSNTTKTKVKGSVTESSLSKFGANFTVGKMISDNWGFLLNAGFSSMKSSTPDIVNGVLYNLQESRNDYYIAPTFRYYRPISEGYFFFVQTSVLLSLGTLITDEFDKNDNLIRYSYNTHGYGFSISPGFTYFMTKKLATEISIGVLGYSSLNGKDDLGNTTHTSNLQFLFYQNSVSLGFVFYL